MYETPDLLEACSPKDEFHFHCETLLLVMLGCNILRMKIYNHIFGYVFKLVCIRFRDVVKGTAKMKVTESPADSITHDKHDNTREVSGKSSQNKEPIRVNSNRSSGSTNHQSK